MARAAGNEWLGFVAQKRIKKGIFLRRSAHTRLYLWGSEYGAPVRSCFERAKCALGKNQLGRFYLWEWRTSRNWQIARLEDFYPEREVGFNKSLLRRFAWWKNTYTLWRALAKFGRGFSRGLLYKLLVEMFESRISLCKHTKQIFIKFCQLASNAFKTFRSHLYPNICKRKWLKYLFFL